MYSPVATKQQLSDAFPAASAQWTKISGRSDFTFKRHSPEVCQQMATQLNALVDAQGKLKRKLSLEERRFIINEQTLCTWDARYYWSRYYKIEHWAGPAVGMVLFEPNIAQRIVLDTWGEREDAGLHISQMILKARQEGITTLCEAAIAHRVQFHPNTNAVVGSSRPDRSLKLINKPVTAWQYVPWYLRPRMTTFKSGELIEFGAMRSSISVQHGAKVQSGIARGETPSMAHLTETAEYLNPERDVDAALVKAMHPHPYMFLVLESTAIGMGGWWYNKWQDSKTNWGNVYAPSQLQPVFLPWYVARDIYPTDTWLQSHPIPIGWSPRDRTKRMADRAAEYVKNTPLLSKYLRSTWNMPREQQWFWEVIRAQHERERTLNIFYQEYCVAGDMRVSTEWGIIPIRDAKGASISELEQITRWAYNGTKPVLEVHTKNGRILKLTPNHKVACGNGSLGIHTVWKEARDLMAGDKITLSQPLLSRMYHMARWKITATCEGRVELTPQWGKFLGYFMGDGCWYGDRVVFACDAKDPDVVDDICANIEHVLGVVPTKLVRGECVMITSHSTRWREILWNLGVLRERWHPSEASSNRRSSGYKRKVCVPECIWRSPELVVKEFLSALFECDGHAYKLAAATRFFTKYPEFARDVQLLLLAFGINAVVRSQIKKTPKGVDYIGYDLQLNAIASDLFHDRIDFVGQRKRSARRQSPNGRNAIKHELTDVVVSVIDGGNSDVYDMTIASEHCFGANGILVHNCSDDIEAFQTTGASVFDAELVMSYNSKARVPSVVYGLDGPSDEIRPELKPSYLDINPNLKPVTITAQRESAKTEYRLIPLKLDGYPNSFNPTGKILIYEPPQDGPDYGLGVDTVPVGVGLDSGAIEVFRKATMSKVAAQCAEFASEWVGAADMFPYAHCLAKLYSRKDSEGNIRQPYIAIETNNGGDGCQLPMRKAGWGRMHPWFRPDKKEIDASKATHLGVLTTGWSRDLVVGYMCSALKDGLIDIDSPWFIQEMQALEAGATETGKTKIAAVLGRHDDRFMAGGWVYLVLHLTEFGETRSVFGRGRILEDTEQPKPASVKPPAPEELPVASDFVADRMIQNVTDWYQGDGMDRVW